jgi:hypothetical protein
MTKLSWRLVSTPDTTRNDEGSRSIWSGEIERGYAHAPKRRTICAEAIARGRRRRRVAIARRRPALRPLVFVAFVAAAWCTKARRRRR